MAILLTILYIIISVVVLLLLLALLLKKEFKLEKQVVISQPPQVVYDYMKLLKNQEYYSVWVMKDPNVKLLYTGVDGTVGATSAWESNDKNVGIGAQEIKGLQPGKSMNVEIRFKKPFEATNYATNTLEALPGTQTKLTHTFTGKQKFPLNLMNLFMDKMVGGDMQQNLLNMKALLEK